MTRIANGRPVENGPRSRDATDQLLAGLRTGNFRPAAWCGFLIAATHRSVCEAVRHPRALAEATVLHGALGLLAERRRPGWIATSWAMTALHLGLLEERRTLGLANTLTLIRANLPVLESRVGPVLPVVALVTDFLDGTIARRTGTTTRFGAQADVLTDTVVWTWFALRHEPSLLVRIATISAWAVPVVTITVASFRRGEMVDLRRPDWARPGAVMEVVLCLRALTRLRHP